MVKGPESLGFPLYLSSLGYEKGTSRSKRMCVQDGKKVQGKVLILSEPFCQERKSFPGTSPYISFDVNKSYV